jgi:hypothetical protein
MVFINPVTVTYVKSNTALVGFTSMLTTAWSFPFRRVWLPMTVRKQRAPDLIVGGRFREIVR